VPIGNFPAIVLRGFGDVINRHAIAATITA
jgi:hypothetical protein